MACKTRTLLFEIITYMKHIVILYTVK